MSEDDNVPAMPGKNPFENYADRADDQKFGPLLKFTKGDWLVGRDGDECPETELVALMPGLMIGWIRWEDGFPVDHKMGLMMEGFVPPARDTLGYLDQAQWEKDEQSGKPRDPWRESAYLPMVSTNGEKVYTFATSSDGGRRRAIVPLCSEYGKHIRFAPDEVPLVKLDQDSYQHPNRTIGRVKFPLLPVQKWVKADVYFAAVLTLTGKTLKSLPGKAA
jgi:hypothetical protein